MRIAFIMESIEQSNYSVPEEADNIYHEQILGNPLVPSLPLETKKAAQLTTFTGSYRLSIPINWRFAESVSALKAFEASMLNVLRSKKYSVPLSKVSINTDQASLFVMSPFLAKLIDEHGKDVPVNCFDSSVIKNYRFPSTDLHDCVGWHRLHATNI